MRKIPISVQGLILGIILTLGVVIMALFLR